MILLNQVKCVYLLVKKSKHDEVIKQVFLNYLIFQINW